MGYVFFALVAALFPLFYTLLKQHPDKRPLAFVLLGFLLFVGGSLRVEGSLIVWPMWTGLERGIGIAPTDMMAAAILATRRPLGGKTPFWGLLLFFTVPVWLSVAFAAVPMAAAFSCWQTLRIILLFAAVVGEVDNPVIRKHLLSGMACGLMLQAFYVAQQKASGIVQAPGTMFHQNTLGMMVELALLPMLGALLGGVRGKLLLAGIVTALFIIAAGGSRGTMSIAGVAAVALALVSIMRSVTPVKMKIAGFMALAIALAVPLAVVTLKDRFGGYTITVKDDTRENYEMAARAMAVDHPLGVGANQYVVTANTQGYAVRAGIPWDWANRSAPVHNAYLLRRAETGWLGEIALWCLLIIPFGRAIMLAFSDRRNPWGEAALGSAAALGANLVHNFFEFAMLTYYVQTLVIVNVAIIAASMRATRAAGRQRRKDAPARPRGGELDVRPA